MGAVVAFELSRRGASVLVLEKGALGLGSTGRSSAIIRQHYSNHLTTRMARDSLRVFEAFDDLVGGDCGFRNTGFLAIAGGADAESLRRNVAIQEELDVPCRIVTPDELPDFLPGATGYAHSSSNQRPTGEAATPAAQIMVATAILSPPIVTPSASQCVTGVPRRTSTPSLSNDCRA